MLGGPLIDEPLVPESEEEVPDEFKPLHLRGLCLCMETRVATATILRDTAASQSILLRGVLEMESGNSALIRGVEMNWFQEPLFHVTLDSGIVSGPLGISSHAPWVSKVVSMCIFILR